jgi:hypothetical protein
MATLEFEGFKFTGTSEECAALAFKFRTLKASTPVQRVPEVTPTPTAAPEAKGATKELPFSKGTLPRVGLKDSEPVDDSAIRFIKAIMTGTPMGGVTGDDLMLVLDVNHPKGVGSKAASINRAIVRLGYKVEDVYTKTRGSDMIRRWKAGPKAWDALKAFEDISKKVVKSA